MKRDNFYFGIDVPSLQEGFNFWPHSSHYKALGLIKPNSRVLDLGCSKGYMAKELAKRGCQVVGIEKDHDSCEIAKKYCQQVIELDINNLELLPLPEEYFDYIICLDILEHLIRPDMLLYQLCRYLSPNGALIVSIPNVARFEYRINLFFGNFNYSESGALSKGHLRFFTLKTAQKLLKSSGYKIEQRLYTGLASIIRVFPTLLAFQFLFLARKIKKI